MVIVTGGVITMANALTSVLAVLYESDNFTELSANLLSKLRSPAFGDPFKRHQIGRWNTLTWDCRTTTKKPRTRRTIMSDRSKESSKEDVFFCKECKTEVGMYTRHFTFETSPDVPFTISRCYHCFVWNVNSSPWPWPLHSVQKTMSRIHILRPLHIAWCVSRLFVSHSLVHCVLTFGQDKVSHRTTLLCLDVATWTWQLWPDNSQSSILFHQFWLH